MEDGDVWTLKVDEPSYIICTLASPKVNIETRLKRIEEKLDFLVNWKVSEKGRSPIIDNKGE